MRFTTFFLVSPLLLLCACGGSGDGGGGSPADDSGASGTTDAAAVETGLDARVGGEGDDCASQKCADGLFCMDDPWSTDFTRHCRSKVDTCLGSPCGDAGYCQLFSTDGKSFFGVCIPRRDLGESCDSPPNWDLDVNTCVDGTYCDESTGFHGTCSAPFSLGADCHYGETSRFECGAGNTCATPKDISLPGACAKAASKGGSCWNSEDCGIGLYCESSTGRCAARKPVGATCGGASINATQSCVTGAGCSGGTCQ